MRNAIIRLCAFLCRRTRVLGVFALFLFVIWHSECNSQERHRHMTIVRGSTQNEDAFQTFPTSYDVLSIIMDCSTEHYRGGNCGCEKEAALRELLSHRQNWNEIVGSHLSPDVACGLTDHCLHRAGIHKQFIRHARDGYVRDIKFLPIDLALLSNAKITTRDTAVRTEMREFLPSIYSSIYRNLPHLLPPGRVANQCGDTLCQFLNIFITIIANAERSDYVYSRTGDANSNHYCCRCSDLRKAYPLESYTHIEKENTV